MKSSKFQIYNVFYSSLNCGFILSQSGVCDKRFFVAHITRRLHIGSQVLMETDQGY